MNIKRQIIPPIITMIFVISSGMIGYTLIEKWSLFDSMFYALSVGARVIFEGEIREILGRKKLSKKIYKRPLHYMRVRKDWKDNMQGDEAG
jgi:hypothetical protein